MPIRRLAVIRFGCGELNRYPPRLYVISNAFSLSSSDQHGEPEQQRNKQQSIDTHGHYAVVLTPLITKAAVGRSSSNAQ